jgi:hypothetical protein
MKAPLVRRLLFCTATLLAFTLPARASAQAQLVPGTWSIFEWFLGIGPVDGSGFLLDATQRMRLRVTDAGVTGDAYDVFVNGLLLAATPSVSGGVFTGAFDGDVAWADPGLSKVELFLNPGRYMITLAVRETASGFDFGEGFIRADAAPIQIPGVAPEPATVVTLATGLLGVAVFAPRLRRRSG